MATIARASQKSIAAEYQPLDTDLQRADQLSSYCANLARMLHRTPLFDGTGSLRDKFKVISLARRDDARICEIFNRNSIAILGENRAWRIHSFGSENYHLFDQNGAQINQGVALPSFDKYKKCSLEELEQSYKQVFSKMTTGWVKADINDHPSILFLQNPNEFDLFIKNTPLFEECILMNSIASRFSLSKDVRCHDLWVQSRGPTIYGRPYLWIRKSALLNVVDKMGLKFENKSKL